MAVTLKTNKKFLLLSIGRVWDLCRARSVYCFRRHQVDLEGARKKSRGPRNL